MDYAKSALQSLTGKYREIQGKPCNENREPAMRTGFPCNESRYFPVGIDLQGFPVSCTGFGFAVCYPNKPLLTMKSQYTAPPILVAIGLSKILKVKQKLGVTFNC